MREILFRGKQKVNGEWVFGNLVVYGCEHEYVGIDVLGGFYRVDPETVGQYTGLKDKNGTEIFEGDIVKLTDKHWKGEWYAKVEFGNPYGRETWGYEFVYIKGDKVNTDCLLWVEMEEVGVYCEVIGNIYDNPELL